MRAFWPKGGRFLGDYGEQTVSPAVGCTRPGDEHGGELIHWPKVFRPRAVVSRDGPAQRWGPGLDEGPGPGLGGGGVSWPRGRTQLRVGGVSWPRGRSQPRVGGGGPGQEGDPAQRGLLVGVLVWRHCVWVCLGLGLGSNPTPPAGMPSPFFPKICGGWLRPLTLGISWETFFTQGGLTPKGSGYGACPRWGFFLHLVAHPAVWPVGEGRGWGIFCMAGEPFSAWLVSAPTTNHFLSFLFG